MPNSQDQRSYIKRLETTVHHLMQRNADLSDLISKDPQTGLPIPRQFSRHLTAIMADQTRNPEQLKIVVMVLRLDRSYRQIRDFRDQANALIFKSVMRIKEIVGDQVYQSSRIDEFLIMLSVAPRYNVLKLIGTRISEAIHQRHAPPADDISFGCNIGIAMESANVNASSLIENAFIALEESKRIESPYVVYSENTGERYRERLLINRDLFTLIESSFRDLRVFYQPIVRSSGEIIGAEALIRWQHPQRGLLAPRHFIPIAEERGHIHHIDQWMFYQVCRQIGEWRQRNLRQIFVAVNLSPVEFSKPDLPLRARAIMEAHNVPGEQIELEITERTLMYEPQESIRIMQQLRDLGIRLSIDDFGTGYSSLSYLMRFPLDLLKIDRTFVTNIANDTNSASIVKIIISLARTLNIEVLAEGVDNPEQVTAISALGCDIFQGYYFAKPMPDSQFWALMERDIPLPLDA